MRDFKFITIMASILSLVAVTGCDTAKSGTEEIIEKPEYTVVDGKFTPELLEAFGRVASPVVSPDGTKILYSVGFESIKQNKGNRELWVMDINGENQKRLTHTAESESNAVWIDGGNKIAFTSKAENGVQIFVMNADGTDRKQISNVEAGVEGFLFSPDETKVMYISTVKWKDTTNDKYPDLDKTSGRVIDDLMYKHWDEWVENIPHPFIAEFDGKSLSNAIDIMEGEPFEAPMRPFGGSESFSWSPDGKKLLYVSRKKQGLDYSVSTNSDIYRYDIESKNTENLTEGMMGYDTNPAYSPDGTMIAWLSMERDGYEADKNRIFVMNVETGEKTDLTDNWDYSVDQIAWEPGSKYIYFIAPYLGDTPIFAINVETQEIADIANGQYDYAALQPVNDSTLITLRHSMLEPNEVYSVVTGEVKQLTSVNADLLSQLSPITIERRMIPTTDGKEMLTWVLLPPNFDKTKKYPAILYCQGGPQSAVSQFWSYRWNLRLMASQGYVVIAPNRRGLPGFGTEWNEQISGDYGGQNMKDYFAAVDAVKTESWVDETKIGAVGASYGGFSVYWLAGHHENRFAAFIAHAGIFNLEAQYLETEEMWFANWDMGGAYWDKNNAIAQNTFANSPHRFVDKWNAPIMITVGEKDYRIVATQGMQAFNAAKLRGIPTRMVVFPDENHWILKPQNALLWQREFFAWLDQWLKN
ncbi:MAG: alpha/beta fold hydrolase [Muribaculaceae bacterium]